MVDVFLLNEIAQTIYDKKGINILALDVHSVSSITNYCIIAEGHADTHVQAICNALIEKLGVSGYTALHIDGKKSGEWIAMDYGSFIIHLFKPGIREKYYLEELWQQAAIVPVSIVVASHNYGTDNV